MTGHPSDPQLRPNLSRLLWLILGPVICAVMGLATFARLRPDENKLHDFVQEWTSARNWLQGEPIYEDLRRSVADDIRPDLVATLPIQYNAHPPASVLLTLPFGWLPYPQAVVVWNVLSLLMLAASLALILGPGGLAFPRWAAWPVVSLLLLSSPLAHQVYMAQLNLLLLFLFTVAWRLDRAGLFAWCGVIVGLAAAIKIFPAFLFLYFLAQRRYSALAAGAGTLILLNALSLLVLGFSAWESYVTVVMPAVAGFRAAWVNASITGLWAKLFDTPNPAVMPLLAAPWLARTLTVVTSLALAAATLWATFRATSRPQRDYAFAACVVATLLLSPIVWHHYFVILTLPLLILWRWLPPAAPVRGLLCVAIVLMAINPAWVMGVDVPIPGPGGQVIQPTVATPLKTVTALSFQFYTLIALWVAGLAGSRTAAIESARVVAEQARELTASSIGTSTGAHAMDAAPLPLRT